MLIGYMKTYESEINFREDCQICVNEWEKKEKIADLKLNNVRFGSLLWSQLLDFC